MEGVRCVYAGQSGGVLEGTRCVYAGQSGHLEELHSQVHVVAEPAGLPSPRTTSALLSNAFPRPWSLSACKKVERCSSSIAHRRGLDFRAVGQDPAGLAAFAGPQPKQLCPASPASQQTSLF